MEGNFSAHDEALIEMAYETTYRSTFRQILNQLESEEAQKVVLDIINEVELED